MLEVKLDCVGRGRVRCNKDEHGRIKLLFVIYTCSNLIRPRKWVIVFLSLCLPI